MEDRPPPPDTSTPEPMRIGELAEKSGRTVRTLHFYEELGLLEPASRTKGGFRIYDKYALLRIQWISRLQDLGFSLPEIKTFLDGLHQRTPDAPAMMSELQAFYLAKLEETRSTLLRLGALERELQASLSYLSSCRVCAPATGKHVCRACPDESHLGQEAPPLVAAIQQPQTTYPVEAKP